MPELNCTHIAFLKTLKEYPGTCPTKFQKCFKDSTMKTVLKRLAELVGMGFVIKETEGRNSKYYVTASGKSAITDWDRTIRGLMKE